MFFNFGHKYLCTRVVVVKNAYVHVLLYVGHVYEENIFLSLGFAKRDFKFAYGNGKSPSMQVCIG
jgi:hypothetical protein